jgi:general secretion pathway protein D
MVFLRPTVLRDSQKADSLTGSRYDYILGEQKKAAAPPSPPLPNIESPVLPPLPNAKPAPPPPSVGPAPLPQ